MEDEFFMMLDPHGQPYGVQFNAARRTERDLSEMLGLVKAMLVDGVVTDVEAKYLRDWGSNHPDALKCWPASQIFGRLQQYFADGRIDDTERADLQELLSSLIGGTASLVLGYEGATTLPLDTPPPLVCWHKEVYVFTGKFAYGTRKDCEREVTGRGGLCESNITRNTSFLVIGTFGSRDWAQTSYGRKIQKAADLKLSGFPVRIIGEDHWARALSPAPPSSA
jgi:NAD-dependent DNA ligase